MNIPTSAPPNTHTNANTLLLMGLMIEFRVLSERSAALCARVTSPTGHRKL